MYTIDFDKPIKKIIAKWKKSNPKLFKKLVDILEDIEEHPRSGLGHPEPLIGGGDIVYSRHITGMNRIIYEIYDDKVLVIVLKLEGHYSDK